MNSQGNHTNQINQDSEVLANLSFLLTEKIGKGWSEKQLLHCLRIAESFRMEQIISAQYLTELPSKAWFADKLHRALEIAKQNSLNPKSPD